MIAVSGPQAAGPPGLASLRRQVRLVVLLDSAERAGLGPIAILRLHMLAYFSNVLAPVWELPVLEGKLLKRGGGPFYPVMQADLDRLVGMGVVLISDLSHVLDEEGRWRLEGSYMLNRAFAARILDSIDTFPLERRLRRFVEELSYAVSALSFEDIDAAAKEDATYSDPVVDVGSVLDFAEWETVNYSAKAARHFRDLLPGGSRATPGELLHLYVDHLQLRLHGGR